MLMAFWHLWGQIISIYNQPFLNNSFFGINQHFNHPLKIRLYLITEEFFAFPD
jgi:hypothetical protein